MLFLGCYIVVVKRFLIQVRKEDGGRYSYNGKDSKGDRIKDEIAKGKGCVNKARKQRTISISCLIIAASEGKSRALLGAASSWKMKTDQRC